MRRGTRRQRKQRKQRKQQKQRSRKNRRSNKLSRRLLLSNKLRGGNVGIPTILTLEGTPLPSNAVVAHPTYTESLQSYLANQRRRGSTGYDDGD